jgi:hypothetical protein
MQSRIRQQDNDAKLKCLSGVNLKAPFAEFTKQDILNFREADLLAHQITTKVIALKAFETP